MRSGETCSGGWCIVARRAVVGDVQWCVVVQRIIRPIGAGDETFWCVRRSTAETAIKESNYYTHAHNILLDDSRTQIQSCPKTYQQIKDDYRLADAWPPIFPRKKYIFGKRIYSCIHISLHIFDIGIQLKMIRGNLTAFSIWRIGVACKHEGCSAS